MNVKRTRTILWMTSLALAASAAGIVTWHLVQPPALSPKLASHLPTDPDSASQIRPAHVPAQVKADPDQLQALAKRDFRQRLFDPPVVVPPPPPPKPLPAVELVSTILREGGDPTAWVRDGQTHRKVGIGDRVGTEDNPATVMQITADQVVLDHDGQQAIITRNSAGGRR